MAEAITEQPKDRSPGKGRKNAISRAVADPVSRRKFVALTGGSSALAAFLAACGGSDDNSTTSTTASTSSSGAIPPPPADTFGKGDLGILNYALTLEYLEAAFYAEAVRVGGYTGAVGTFARTVASHEATHVATLQGVLGSKAVKSPSFDFKGTTRKWHSFLRTAKVLEDTGVQAYQGQTPFIRSQTVFKAAISIHPVEARHAAWVRQLAHQSPAPAAFNPALTKSQVLAAVGATGCIK